MELSGIVNINYTSGLILFDDGRNLVSMESDFFFAKSYVKRIKINKNWNPVTDTHVVLFFIAESTFSSLQKSLQINIDLP